MTASHLIVQPDAAYLITDTAVYSPAGVLVEFSPKVLTLNHLVASSVAIASTGAWMLPQLADYLASLPLRTVVDVLEALPAAMRELERQLAAHGREGETIGWRIASYDALAGRVAGHIIFNDAAWAASPGSGYEPYTVRQVDWSAFFDHRAVLGREDVHLSDPRQFDVAHYAPLILEQQRRETDADIAGGNPIVGGVGHLTRVDATGVSTTQICAWPQDRVGERIKV